MTRIDSVKIQRGHLSRTEWSEVYAAYAKMQKLPIVIEDSSDHTPASIRSAFRMGQRKIWDRFGKHVKVKLCAIDYLQLLNARAMSDNREQEIAAISRSNKAMAKDEDIAVLSLAQVNRDCEKRPDKRPMLSDLRESGAIEQEADSVIFIYREDYYRPKDQEKDDKAEFIVSKLRDNGGPGIVHVMFDPKTTTFFEENKNPDFEQLGDMFDEYLPGTYGEPGAVPNTPHWTDERDD
jgi:replicative DNA helicase